MSRESLVVRDIVKRCEGIGVDLSRGEIALDGTAALLESVCNGVAYNVSTAYDDVTSTTLGSNTASLPLPAAVSAQGEGRERERE